MSTIGLGAFAVGLTPAGMYAFSSVAEDSDAVGERYIDPMTGDYARRDGVILRGTSARQKVINCLINSFGSSLGVRGFKSPKVHNENTPRAAESEVRAALRPIIEDGSISVEQVSTGIQFQGIPGRMGVFVAFTDLETGIADRVMT